MFYILFGLAVALGHFLNKYLLSYWSRRGFQQTEPKFLIGDAGPLILLKSSLGETIANFYHKNKQHKVFGIYMFYRPILVINDLMVAQDIMIKDFNNFHDRPMPVDEENDPLSAHLFSVAGQKWRDLRVKFTPTFTSGKLKGMFPIIRSCGQTLEDYLIKNKKTGVDVFEFRDLMARFNTNIISSVAFGIENDCINEPDHIFRRMGAKFFATSVKNGLRSMISFIGPKLLHKLKIKVLDQDVEDFMLSIVKQTVEYREKNNVTRNDFMQLMIQLKNQGFVSVDKGEEQSEEAKNVNVKKLNMNQLAAQAFVFFIAGFETSSSTMSFCLFELAKNPDLQRKVQDEIDRVYKKAGAEGVTYDMLAELKYLECCVDETLRKYPIIPVHFRTAARDYKINGTDLTIPEGSSVFIPVFGIQRDREIYEDPLKFKPERFLNSSNGGGKGKGLIYSPFGDGPRNCIGMRLGKVTTKIGIAVILSKFNIELEDKNMDHKELDIHPNQFVLTPVQPLRLRISSR